MEYNTSRGNLIIPEYGRNVQKMVQHCLTLEDREERNLCAKSIVRLMGQLNNQFKDAEDFQNTLWTHLYIISDFKLDIESPFPVPRIEEINTKPNRVAYPNSKVKYRHYGKTIEEMIKKAKDYEEGDEKAHLVKLIAELMKRAYLKWNRDTVRDEIIFKQLKELSDNKIQIPEGMVLTSTIDPEDLKQNTNNSSPINHKRKKHTNTKFKKQRRK
jgi:hypothetical protein